LFIYYIRVDLIKFLSTFKKNSAKNKIYLNKNNSFYYLNNISIKFKFYSYFIFEIETEYC